MAFIGDLTNVLSQGAGVMSPLGAIAGGVSALGSLFGKSDSDKAMELAEKQHQWDVEENQKNRDFQSAEWQRQFDAINAYNDPSKTKERLTKAGLNGSAMLNGQGAAIGQSTGSPSAPSGASGLNPMPDVVSQVGFQSRESLFKRLEMLGNLAKNSYLLPETKEKLSAEIQDTLNDAKYKDVKAQSEEFMLALNKIIAPYERKAGLMQAMKNLALADAEIRLKGSQASEADARAAQLAEEKVLTVAKRYLSEKELEMLKLEIKWYDKEREQNIRESKSREVSNYASANESNAAAREHKASAEQIEFWNRINNRPDVKHELVREAKERGKAAVNANAISERQAKQLDFMIEQAAYANSMKEFTYWSDQIQGILGSVGEAASSFYGAGALRELINLRKIQQSAPTRVTGFGN